MYELLMGKIAVSDLARDSFAFRGAVGGRWSRDPRGAPGAAAGAGSLAPLLIACFGSTGKPVA